MPDPENASSLVEKQLSPEKRQEILQSTSVWLRKIIDEQHDPDVHELATLATATSPEARKAGGTTILAIYDFIDQYAIELSDNSSSTGADSVTHLYLGQKAGGIWQLQTTGSLSNADDEALDIDKAHAEVVHELRLQEPLYPSSLREASDSEIVAFNEIVELGAFGDLAFDFSALDSFRADIDSMKKDIDDIEKNNP